VAKVVKLFGFSYSKARKQDNTNWRDGRAGELCFQMKNSAFYSSHVMRGCPLDPSHFLKKTLEVFKKHSHFMFSKYVT